MRKDKVNKTMALFAFRQCPVQMYIASININKVDIVGLILQKGGILKEDLGLIEVLDYSSYAAIKTNRIEKVVELLKNEKIKNKKVKIQVSI